MSEERAILIETAERVLNSLPGDFSSAWSRIDDAGFALLMVPEEDGGFGGTWDDVLPVARLCGLHANAIPLCEAIVATLLAHTYKLHLGAPATICTEAVGVVGGGKFTGTLRHVPWGREAKSILAIIGNDVFVVQREAATGMENAESPAGEPRDMLHFEGVPAASANDPAWSERRLLRIMAMMRTAQMAGALDAVLQLTTGYARDRKQFGRPLAAFQAIQQQLAVLAEEAAATDMAAASAFHAATRGEAPFEMACAKLRANRAAMTGTGIAHQVHGAIGFTQEYDLQKFTRRLWAWASEFGNERFWADEIGAKIAAHDADRFWHDFVKHSDHVAHGE